MWWVGENHEGGRRGLRFSDRLSKVTHAQTSNIRSVYIARNKAIKVETILETQHHRVTRDALLNSGATENFIHPDLVDDLYLERHKLAIPWRVKNVDGTLNRAGDVTHSVNLRVNYEKHTTLHKFLITNIGENDLILGFPFFKATYLVVNWTKGKALGHVWIKGITTVTKEQINWASILPDWEEGNQLWLHTTIGKTTVAQQLAEKATDQKKKTWQELIPPRYHEFGSIFLEAASERFPDKQWWDHAIDLKPDAPTSIDCRVYPLSPKEKEEQREFLESNLWLQCIQRSNSPYASGFFLIQKKDKKFRPIQDYQRLNQWTVPNKYPLPLISELIHDLAGKKLFSKSDVW
jgi:hypothetical protein